MWMKRIKKAALAVSVLGMLGGSALAVTPAEQTYLDAVNYMGNHPEGTYTWQYKAVMPFMGEMVLHSDQYIRTEPLQSRIDVWGTMMNKKAYAGSGYIEQDGAKLMFYYPREEKGKTQWYKLTVPLKDATPLIETIRSQTHSGALNGVKSVTTADSNTYDVVYDMSRVYQPGDEAKWEKQGVTRKEDIELYRDILMALKSSGDLTVHMTINPKTRRITRVDIPLTPQMRAVSGKVFDILEKAEPDKKAEIAMFRQFADNSTITAKGEWKELPEDIDLSVPKDIKKKATETKEVKVHAIADGKTSVSLGQTAQQQ